MEPILFLIVCLTIAIVFFISWRINRRQRIKNNKSKQPLMEYERQQKEGQARRLMEQLHDLVWVDLLDLRKRHKNVTHVHYSDDFLLEYSWNQDSCWGELSWATKPGGAHPCWLEIVNKEICRRIEELLRNRDMKEVQNLAMTRDLDQAWEAIGTTAEGVAWLEAGLHSTSSWQRARCHRTLYDGE